MTSITARAATNLASPTTRFSNQKTRIDEERWPGVDRSGSEGLKLVEHPGDGAAKQPDPVPKSPLAARPSRLRRWLREPLLHFLLVGLALFVVYDALHPTSGAQSKSSRIVLTPDDFEQLGVTWLAQGRPPPN